VYLLKAVEDMTLQLTCVP